MDDDEQGELSELGDKDTDEVGEEDSEEEESMDY